MSTKEGVLVIKQMKSTKQIPLYRKTHFVYPNVKANIYGNQYEKKMFTITQKIFC